MRLLILSPSSLPDFSPLSLQAWIIARHLQLLGWDVTTVSGSLFQGTRRDLSFFRETSAVHSLPPLPAILRKGGAWLLPAEYRNSIEAVLLTVVARRKMSPTRPAVILSLQTSAHLAGAALARLWNIPFVPYFIDPFHRNPYRDDSPRAQRWYTRTMTHILRRARLALFPTPEMAEGELDGLDVHTPYAVVPHAIDRSLVPFVHAIPLDDGIVHVGHFGSIYGKRTLAPLLAALDLLRDDGVGYYERLRVDLYTSFPPPQEIRAAARHMAVVRFLPELPYRDAVTAQGRYHALLVLDAPSTPYPFLPSKLLEALAQGKTALGISPPTSVSTRVLRAYGHVTADIFSPPDIARAFRELIDDLQADPRRSLRPPVHDFDDTRVVGRLHELLCEATRP